MKMKMAARLCAGRVGGFASCDQGAAPSETWTSDFCRFERSPALDCWTAGLLDRCTESKRQVKLCLASRLTTTFHELQIPAVSLSRMHEFRLVPTMRRANAALLSLPILTTCGTLDSALRPRPSARRFFPRLAPTPPWLRSFLSRHPAEYGGAADGRPVTLGPFGSFSMTTHPVPTAPIWLPSSVQSTDLAVTESSLGRGRWRRAERDKALIDMAGRCRCFQPTFSSAGPMEFGAVQFELQAVSSLLRACVHAAAAFRFDPICTTSTN